MTRAKKWPHNAEWARMDVITNQAVIRRAVRDILPLAADGYVLQKLNLIMDRAWDSEVKLNRVGANSEREER